MNNTELQKITSYAVGILGIAIFTFVLLNYHVFFNYIFNSLSLDWTIESIFKSERTFILLSISSISVCA